MAHRRTTIALILDRLSSEYAVQLRRAVERAASQRNVSILCAMGQPLGAPNSAATTQNRIYELINPERVDGVLLVSATVGHYCGAEGLLALCRGYAPLPVCSIGVELPGVPSLVVDNEGGMELGVKHLIHAHHCQRIAFIAGQEASVESNYRLAGYRKALEDAGLTYDPRLVRHGDFTIETGFSCMKDLMQSGAAFDAVVAANDDMALGALDLLGESGLHVPRDVIVSGFDDINSAHFARPSLSTLRQPMWWLGEAGIDTIVAQIEGKSVPLTQAGSVDFVRRESCGCGYQVAVTLHPSADAQPSITQVIEQNYDELVAVMRAAVTVPNEALGDWPERLLSALEAEVRGEENRFSTAFEQVLEQAQYEGASLDEFQRVVSVMRSEFRRIRIENYEDTRLLERIWHNARVLVGAASIRLLGRQKLEQQEVSAWLSWVGERLSTTLSLSLLKEQLYDSMPRVHISRGVVSLYTAPSSQELKVLVARCAEGQLQTHETTFPESRLAPAELFDDEECRHFIALPITFETEMLGVAILESGTLASVYESLRQQIGSAVKGAMMHREMVAQVTLRERLEAERMVGEARLAAELQTSIQPALLDVPGLEIAAASQPAAEAGGDYYDVQPHAGGAWLAIGDVTGHGLASGLVMLMIQSMVASLSRLEVQLQPSEVVSAIGDAIWDNVRCRLKRDDHATLTVFRYFGKGKFRFAGAHEDIIVFRKKTGKCETIATPGFWVGAIPSVRRMTEDVDLQLDSGDIMVLYSDGITEARNAHHQQFSLERLVTSVEAVSSRSCREIRDSIVEQVKHWSASIDDDITLVVCRVV